MAMLILLVLLIFFAALGIPLAFAIGASCVTYILIYAPTFITMLPQRVWNGAYSELMIAMPLFMLAGVSPDCSTPSAAPTSSKAKPAASPSASSTSAWSCCGPSAAVWAK